MDEQNLINEKNIWKNLCFSAVTLCLFITFFNGYSIRYYHKKLNIVNKGCFVVEENRVRFVENGKYKLSLNNGIPVIVEVE